MIDTIKNNSVVLGAYLLFVSAIVYCLNQYNDFSIIDNAISNFGINSSTKYVFMVSIILLSLCCLWVQQSVKFKRGIKKLLIIGIRLGAVIASLSLIVVATVDLTHFAHNLFAFIYFILMPLMALGFAIIFRLEGERTISKYLFIISISNFVVSIILATFVKGFFICEIVHSQFVFVYIFLLNRKL